jgi:hypothetical protein
MEVTYSPAFKLTVRMRAVIKIQYQWVHRGERDSRPAENTLLFSRRCWVQVLNGLHCLTVNWKDAPVHQHDHALVSKEDRGNPSMGIRYHCRHV